MVTLPGSTPEPDPGDNGSPGLVFLDGATPEMVMCADLDEPGRIVRIFGQMNPDKLRHVTS